MRPVHYGVRGQRVHQRYRPGTSAGVGESCLPNDVEESAGHEEDAANAVFGCTVEFIESEFAILIWPRVGGASEVQ